MSKRIDLLLNRPKSTGGPKRIIDIEAGAPYVNLMSNKSTILLPMPVTVSSRNQIMWDQKEFTADSIRGATAIDLWNKKSNISVWQGTKQGMAGALQGLAKDVVSSVGSAVAGIDGAGDYILHKDGLAVNPNKEMTFNGIGYRAFTLEFELIPLNSKDAKGIKEFIRFFQSRAMPDYAGDDTVYFAYPDAWQVIFSNASWLPKIMPCYLTDYSIGYGGVGKMVAHTDSSVQTNISLTFTESQLHTKSRIDDGYVG